MVWSKLKFGHEQEVTVICADKSKTSKYNLETGLVSDFIPHKGTEGVYVVEFETPGLND